MNILSYLSYFYLQFYFVLSWLLLNWLIMNKIYHHISLILELISSHGDLGYL